MKRLLTSFVVFLLIIGFTATASALTINYNQLTVGQSNVYNADWSATASSGNFQQKSQAGWTGVGISGKTAGEIDIAESILFAFSTAQHIDDFILTLLFSQGPYGDPNEKAEIIVNETYTYILTAKYPAANATWVAVGANASSATIDNLSPANTTAGAAVWEVFNPFGDTAVTSLRFTAIHNVGGNGNDSDYCFNKLTSSAPVPEPASMLLLGSGLLGMAGFRKKIKK